jgi:hypothetical protein
VYRKLTLNELTTIMQTAKAHEHWEAYTHVARLLYGNQAHMVVTAGYSEYNDETYDDAISYVAVYDANGACLSHRYMARIENMNYWDADAQNFNSEDIQIGTTPFWHDQEEVQRAYWADYRSGPFQFSAAEAFWNAIRQHCVAVDSTNTATIFLVNEPPTMPDVYVWEAETPATNTTAAQPMTIARQRALRSIMMLGDDE